MFRKIKNGLKARLDAKTRTMVQAGYLNENLSRTKLGLHQIATFIENHPTFGRQFVAYLEDVVERDAEEDGDE